jgi:hypothetical protein
MMMERTTEQLLPVLQPSPQRSPNRWCHVLIGFTAAKPGYFEYVRLPKIILDAGRIGTVSYWCE